MNRVLGLLLLCLVAGEAWGATWYVTPTGAGATDGTSLANAFAGTADVAWGSIAAGDTLCASGTFTGAAASDVSGITLRIDTSGTDVTHLVTVDGDCDGDGVKAQLDGNNEVGIGIRTAIVGTSQTTWLAVKNFVLRQYTNKAVVTYNATSDETADAHQTWTGMEIYDHGDGGTGDNCFDSRGGYIELSHSIISGCDEDGVYHSGAHFVSDDMDISDVSRANANGDGIQIAKYANYYHVSNLRCDHTAVDSKQCFITSVLSDTGLDGIFEDSVLLCKQGATNQNCAFVGGTNGIVRRIFMDGGQYGLTIENAAYATGMRIESVISIRATDTGINAAGTLSTGNTITNSIAAFAGSRGISLTPTTPYTLENNIAVGNVGCGINRGHASQTETYNDSYGNGTDFCTAGVSTAAGTGSISVTPGWVEGAAPTSLQGVRLKPTSPLACAGTDVGRRTDALGRGFEPGCTPIGAMVYGRGDARGTALPARP